MEQKLVNEEIEKESVNEKMDEVLVSEKAVSLLMRAAPGAASTRGSMYKRVNDEVKGVQEKDGEDNRPPAYIVTQGDSGRGSLSNESSSSSKSNKNRVSPESVARSDGCEMSNRAGCLAAAGGRSSTDTFVGVGQRHICNFSYPKFRDIYVPEPVTEAVESFADVTERFRVELAQERTAERREKHRRHTEETGETSSPEKLSSAHPFDNEFSSSFQADRSTEESNRSIQQTLPSGDIAGNMNPELPRRMHPRYVFGRPPGDGEILCADCQEAELKGELSARRVSEAATPLSASSTEGGPSSTDKNKTPCPVNCGKPFCFHNAQLQGQTVRAKDADKRKSVVHDPDWDRVVDPMGAFLRKVNEATKKDRKSPEAAPSDQGGASETGELRRKLEVVKCGFTFDTVHKPTLGDRGIHVASTMDKETQEERAARWDKIHEGGVDFLPSMPVRFFSPIEPRPPKTPSSPKGSFKLYKNPILKLISGSSSRLAKTAKNKIFPKCKSLPTSPMKSTPDVTGELKATAAHVSHAFDYFGEMHELAFPPKLEDVKTRPRRRQRSAPSASNRPKSVSRTPPHPSHSHSPSMSPESPQPRSPPKSRSVYTPTDLPLSAGFGSPGRSVSSVYSFTAQSPKGTFHGSSSSPEQLQILMSDEQRWPFRVSPPPRRRGPPPVFFFRCSVCSVPVPVSVSQPRSDPLETLCSAIVKKETTVEELARLANCLELWEINATSHEVQLTPLMLAALVNRPDILDLLIKKGAHPDARAESHLMSTPLLMAGRHGRPCAMLPVARALRLGGADLNAQDIHGCTALCYTYASGNTELSKYLLRYDAVKPPGPEHRHRPEHNQKL